MSALRRHTRIVAAVAGSLWTVKALVITARDGSFDPLESVVFIAGFLGLIAAAVLAAVDLSRTRRGAGRVLVGIAFGVGLIAATTLLTTAGQAALGALAPGDNLGLEEEGGILLAGLAWLAFAVWSPRRAGSGRVAVA